MNDYFSHNFPMTDDLNVFVETLRQYIKQYNLQGYDDFLEKGKLIQRLKDRNHWSYNIEQIHHDWCRHYQHMYESFKRLEFEEYRKRQGIQIERDLYKTEDEKIEAARLIAELSKKDLFNFKINNLCQDI